MLAEGTAFNPKEIDGQAKRQGIAIRKGDVVLFHTGWQALVGKDDKRFLAGDPGLGKQDAEYLACKEVVAVSAPTSGRCKPSVDAGAARRPAGRHVQAMPLDAAGESTLPQQGQAGLTIDARGAQAI